LKNGGKMVTKNSNIKSSKSKLPKNDKIDFQNTNLESKVRLLERQELVDSSSTKFGENVIANHKVLLFVHKFWQLKLFNFQHVVGQQMNVRGSLWMDEITSTTLAMMPLAH
jgi:hypothetical protein